MSRLEVLIQTLCPDGVEYKKLGDVSSIVRGVTYSKNMEVNSTTGYKILRANNITLSSNSVNFADVRIISDSVKVNPNQKLKEKDIFICTASGSKDHIGKVAYIEHDLDYYFGGFMAVIRTKPTLISRFLFHILTGPSFSTYLENTLNSSTINNLNSTILSGFLVPVPPLPVQEEIVRILDTFSGVVTELEQKLEAEQAARTKQYEYYRDKLFDLVNDDSVTYIPLESVIVSLKTGLNPRKNFQLNTEDAKNHYVTVRELAGKDIKIFDKTDKVNDEALRLINNRSNLEVNDILFSGTGTVGRTAIVQNPPTNWNIKEGVYVIKPDTMKINPVYLLYLLQSGVIRKKYEGKIVGSPVISLPMYELRKLIIPVPLLEIQEQIVSILDRFDTLVNDLKSGLPAEIAARRKQYEYYRDKLLTFPQKPPL